MKRSAWLICLAISGILALLFFLRRPADHSTTLAPEHQGVSNVVVDQVGEPPMPENRRASNTPRGPVAPEVVTPGDSNGLKTQRSDQWQAQRVARWQEPIEFYGKVVDENDSPVQGADINFNWMELPTDHGSRVSAAKSDADGLFSLRNARGPSLSVSVSKEGYYTSRSGRQGFKFGFFGDGGFTPDPRNPVVFRLQKKGHGTELITSDNGIKLNVAVRIPRDGTPLKVDLLEKRVSLTGQLEMSQLKPPWREATEWSFRLNVADGGLVENQDEFQFEAPEANYAPVLEYHFTKGETNWTTQVTKQFYIVFGQPRRYGWLRIESNLAQETVFLTYAINPAGSRNLEPK